MRNISKFKWIIYVPIILSLLTGLLYFLFVPEFKKSIMIDKLYVYIDDSRLLTTRYLVAYDEEVQVKIKGDEFKIYLPYAYYHGSDWEYTDNTNKGIELLASTIINIRQPILSRYREGEDHRMQMFKFKIVEEIKGNIIFYYGNKNEEIRKIIININ